MKQPTFLLVSLLAVFSVGCDETTDPGCTLPTGAQLAPSSPEGVLGFELIRVNESSSLDAVFFNGGCEDLQVDLDSITLTEPDGTSHFSLGDVSPTSGRVQARDAFGIPITFTSPGRGVYLATLSFTSNAENLPTYELDLVAPSGESPIPDEPDIEPFEDTVAVEASAAFSEPAALVRFYNLGGRTLQVSDYTLGDDTNFELLEGTATPSAECIYGKICNLEDGLDPGCCGGGLTCRCLGFDTDGSTCLDNVGYYGRDVDCASDQAACDPYGWVCDSETGTCRGTTPAPCLDGGDSLCDDFSPNLECNSEEPPWCACSHDDDCGEGRDCNDGLCTIPAQVCATVNVTSGQFAILGVQLADAAAAGTHSTTLEIASNDPDHPVTSVTITATK